MSKVFFEAGVKVGIDTAPIIYFVEAHPTYDSIVSGVFRQIAQGEIRGVTSVITLAEVLIHPLRRNAIDLHQRYRKLLLHSANFETISITSDVAELGAMLRARYNIRLPDALQLAAAISMDCHFFLTNDKRLAKVTEITVKQLSSLETDR